MKYLITGGAGFIGYHLSKKLLSLGHQVVGIDNFNPYYDVKLKQARADDLGIVKTVDLLNKNHLEEIFSIDKPDRVVHLAAMVGVRHSLNEPRLYIENNIVGTQNLIELCEKYNTEKVIYASSSSVTRVSHLPMDENAPLTKAINPYAYTKQVNEAQFRLSNIPNAIGVRFFTVYGPWGRPDMALFDFVHKIYHEKPITLYNEGLLSRDFTYIDDVINGLEVILNHSFLHGEIINIGRGFPVLLKDFLSIIEEELGKKAIIKYEAKHPADAESTWADMTKLKNLGFTPQTSIETGIKTFVDWYLNQYLKL